MEINVTSTEIQVFSSFDLDPRLTKVLEKQNITKPTLIQEKAIPLALAGKDLLAKAKTGSGKTLAYVLPILHRILSNSDRSIQLLILVPTKELSRQVQSTVTDLLYYCQKVISSVNLAGDESLQLQKSMISSSPTIIISTPSRILPHLESKSLSLETLKFLVLDEADLVLSFGYSSDLNKLLQDYIPKTVQTFLMSASLSPEIDSLKQLMLRNPVILKLEDAEEDSTTLHQYSMKCDADDKFLLMYVILKLQLLKGKIIIFANDVERSFKLKLFLEQFGIKLCILNSELPFASRHHIVDEFNRGVYDIIIASDLSGHAMNGNDKRGKGVKKVKNDKEGGVARGVDFKKVDVIINFDLPQRADSYVHRIGRTARGGLMGTAISFVAHSKEDKGIFASINADQEARGNEIKSHDFDIKQLDGFRYRCNDVLRSITKVVIKKARLQAVKEEITKSEKLKSFFEERPKDLQLLRHDRELGIIQSRPHLKHIPEYLFATDQVENGKRAKIASLPQCDSGSNVTSVHTKKSRFYDKKKSRDVLKSIKCRK